MECREITDELYIEQWNKIAAHPLQAWEWGQFREKTGVRVIRYGLFEKEKLSDVIQVTIHPIPHTPWTVGYFPKGNTITEDHVSVLREIARRHACIYIKCEPKIENTDTQLVTFLSTHGFVRGRSLFTPYNFVLDVKPTEEELLKQMKQKTRYNIRVATKRGVRVAIDDSDTAFERYLSLTKETTERQGFYAHGDEYHRRMWETLHSDKDGLSAHLLTATFDDSIITTWVLFRFGDTLYYPYGASTREHRDVMANNLVMWETIKLAKKWGLRYLDMWGALGPEPDRNDPWYGFHTFKQGYGGRHVSYVGTWDFVTNPILYFPFIMIEKLRWALLRFKKR